MGETKETDILQSVSHTQKLPGKKSSTQKSQGPFPKERLKGGESKGVYQGSDNPWKTQLRHWISSGNRKFNQQSQLLLFFFNS